MNDFQRENLEEQEEVAGSWPEKRLDLARVLNVEPPPRNWFCRDRLLAGRAAALAGIGGSSKTRFQIQLAIGAVIGRTLWGWQIERPGSALLILSEETAEDVHGTIYGTCNALRVTKEERDLVRRLLRVYPMAGEDCRLLQVGQGGAITESPRAGRLLRLLDSIKDLRYLGLDPAIAISDGNEMDATHQRRLGEFTDKLAVHTGAATVLTTHARKSLATAEEVESHSSRGGGSLTDAMRAEYTLRSMTRTEAASRGVAEEDRPAFVQLLCTKGNHIPPAARAPIWLQRSEYGVLVSARDLGEPAEKSSGAGLTHRHTDALKILQEVGGGKNLSAAAWRNALVERNQIRSTSKAGEGEAFRRICAALRAHGLITSIGGTRATAYAPANSPDGIANEDAAS